MRRLVLHTKGWEDVTYWITTDRATTKRIVRLVNDVLRDPFDGIGKPEPLKHSMAGAWSRRITDEHRLVYLVTDKDVVILQTCYHY